MTKLLDRTGTKRGRLTFIKLVHIKNNQAFWECKCDCGNVVIVKGSGKKKSCGCLALEARSNNGKKNKNTQSPIEFIKTNTIVDPKTNCWNWTKSLIDGYARISGHRAKESPLASRYVYKYIKKCDPINKLVCHTCDNPKCVNPDHLFLGTHKTNFIDMKEKGRSARGIKNNKSKLTEKDVLIIRKIKDQLTVKDIANKFQICPLTVRHIINRQTWTHI